ncbi:MAG: hypothetical protein HY721_27095, partial [Planctomycetes bacterium]|nr:hypothetical protein [Planctomycetota bacterium]
GWDSARVLCLGPDGHVDVELVGDFCCDGAPAQEPCCPGAGPGPGCGEGPPRRGKSCGECIHLRIFLCASPAGRGPASSLKPAPTCAFTAPREVVLFASARPAAAARALALADPPWARHRQRNAVLRC